MSDINWIPDDKGVPRCTEKCAGFKKGTADYHLCLFDGEAMVPANGTCYPQMVKMAAALAAVNDYAENETGEGEKFDSAMTLCREAVAP